MAPRGAGEDVGLVFRILRFCVQEFELTPESRGSHKGAFSKGAMAPPTASWGAGQGEKLMRGGFG